MAINFTPSSEPTLGVEVELQLVDLKTRELVPHGPAILDMLDDEEHVKPELLKSTLELNTSVCHSVKEVRRDLTKLVNKLQPLCERLGCGMISAGTHPFSTWPGQEITEQDRYQELIKRVQWPAQRLMIFGLHVHVGMDSGEKAVAVFNALTGHIPQFLALSASSPFWQGNDTGLASVRTKVFETLPTAGLPETLVNWSEFENFMKTLMTAGAIESIREVWWDIRPHPGFGTVELRMCDSLPTMDELIAMTAYMHCVTVWLGQAYDKGKLKPLDHHWIIRENKWRAARWGLDANLIIDNHGNQQTNSDRVYEMLNNLNEISRDLDCEKELALVKEILHHGTSCQRQRSIHKKTGKLEPVVDALLEEWNSNKRVLSV